MSIQQLHTEVRDAVASFAKREGTKLEDGREVYDGHQVSMALLNVLAEVAASYPAEHRGSFVAGLHNGLDDLVEKKSATAAALGRGG